MVLLLFKGEHRSAIYTQLSCREIDYRYLYTSDYCIQGRISRVFTFGMTFVHLGINNYLSQVSAARTLSKASAISRTSRSSPDSASWRRNTPRAPSCSETGHRAASCSSLDAIPGPSQKAGHR